MRTWMWMWNRPAAQGPRGEPLVGPVFDLCRCLFLASGQRLAR